MSSKTSIAFSLYDPRKILEDELAEIRAKKREPEMEKRPMDSDVCCSWILWLLPGLGWWDAVRYFRLPGQDHCQDAQHVLQPTDN